MFTPILLVASLIGGISQAEATLRASLPAGELVVGKKYEMSIKLDLPDGWSAAESGLPNAVLQVDVPDCITLEGEVLEGRALQRNEYLQAPFERMIEGGEATVAFTLTDAPGDDDRIAVNVLAFAQPGEDAEKSVFIRRRVELPIAGGANGSSSEQAKDSAWSGGDPGLMIGAKATSFQLPRADGTTVDLSEYLGKKAVILVTYRAHW